MFCVPLSDDYVRILHFARIVNRFFEKNPKLFFRLSALHAFPVLQLTHDRAPHRDIARKSADQIGDRLGRKNTVYAESGNARQHKCERNDDERLAQKREENRKAGPVQRLECALTGILERHHDKAEEIDVKRRDRRAQHGGILIEDPDKSRREQRDQQPAQRGIAKSNLRHKPDGAAHAAVGLRAVVEADDRRRAVCDRHDRRLRDLPHGIQHGHDADINIAAEREQRRVARDLHEAVRERHHKARNAERRDAPDTGEIRLKACLLYTSPSPRDCS